MGKILTISIAAYNMEKYIDETLSSCIIEKEYMDDMEILIINDGSTDNTVDIAKKYVRKYPNTFRIINKENGGYGTTVNRGIREASGKYFKLLDGDDWFIKERLSQFIEILKNEESDLVITDYVRNESGKRTYEKTNSAYGKSYSLKNRMFVLMMYTICYKTSILKNNAIKLEEKILYTDAEFIIYPLFYVRSVSHYPLFLYEYRLGRSGQSVEIKSRVRHIGDVSKVVDNTIEYYKSHIIDNGAEMMILYEISSQYFENILIFLWRKISKRTKQEMIKREEEIKQENAMVYSMAGMQSKMIWLLRKSRYKLYYFLALYAHFKSWLGFIKYC